MSSITYNGKSFGDYVSAELLEPVAHVVTPETARVPGRPGLVLLSAEVEPLELRVRLFMDDPDALTVAQRSEVRRTLRAWLLSTNGAELVVPGEPTLTWHDALCFGVSDWSSLFAEGSATATFLCLDPIAYGTRMTSSNTTFQVGGTWVTWPTVLMVASEGSSVKVTDSASGSYVLVEGAFAGGERVLVDCAVQTVTIDGADASKDVALGSDFFSLAPGSADLAFEGCSTFDVRFYERWA